jgi:hypothetical protein
MGGARGLGGWAARGGAVFILPNVKEIPNYNLVMLYCIGLVTEADYPALAPLIIHSFAGSDYRAFLENTAQHRRNLRDQGITTVDVYIDPRGFQRWLKGRIAVPNDLSQYAALIRDRQSQTEGCPPSH